MRYLLLIVAGLSLLAAPLLAQEPGGGMLMGGGGSNVICTTQGMFVLRNGVLAKYDLANLQKPETFELFGPAPTMPTDATNRDAVQAYQTEMMRRLAPGLLMSYDDSLLVIVGNGFARLNQKTLAVEATADLTPPADATATETTGRRAMESAPSALIQGDTMYLVRSREVLSLNLKTGAILGRAPLPEEMQPRSFGGGGFGGRGGGGGFGGGGRGPGPQ